MDVFVRSCRTYLACGFYVALVVACQPSDTNETTPAADTSSGVDTAGVSADTVLPDSTSLPDTQTAVDVSGDEETSPPPPVPPNDAWPCSDYGTYWPSMLSSERYPFHVHFRPGEEAEAEAVLGFMETSWAVEVEQLGFTPPLPDGSLCGPDERFDVFLWRGIIESYVDVIDTRVETDWNDYYSYLVVDAWGPYGGELLDVTVAHEFNHACQASDDWWDSPLSYEMTATFIEDVVFDDDNDYYSKLNDFQSRPEWSLDHDDGYVTWYMYTAALYLHFLREHVYAGDASFAAEMWRRMRNPEGAESNPALNEPDFIDALEAMLQEKAGMSYADSVGIFARWRWYTGRRDDGAHFEEGADFPDAAEVVLAASPRADAGPLAISDLEHFGSAYIEVSAVTAGGGPFSVRIENQGSSAVQWLVQAVPGLTPGSDGEVLDLSNGATALVAWTSAETRTLIVTALPTGNYDPDTGRGRVFGLTLHLGP